MGEPTNRTLTLGTIVEFMQDNSPQIGWVMESQNNKVRLMLANRRESSMSISRLLPWTGPSYPTTKGRDEIIQILTKHKENRKQIKEGLDIVSVWEMTQGEVESESAEFFAELIMSSVQEDEIAAFAHALLEHKNYFKFNNSTFDIYSAEMVEAKIEAERLANERALLVSGGAEWFHHLWELHQKGLKLDANRQAPQEPVQSRLKQMLMARIADPETNSDEHLWKQVSKQLPEDPYMALILATSWGIIPEHYNFWLDRADYNPSPYFANAHQNEINNLLSISANLAQEDITPFLSSPLKEDDLAEQNTNSISEQESPASEHSNTIEKDAKDVTDTECGETSTVSLNSMKKEEIETTSLSETASVHENDSLASQSEWKIKNPLEASYQNSDSLYTFFAKLSTENFISIDSASTQDIDDAFTIQAREQGGWHVSVALACPACAWQFHAPFDKLISERTTSLYLPDGTYHMMPHTLSTEAYSLLEGHIRPALICRCDVLADGTIEEARFEFSRIKVQDNLHYDACEAVLLAQRTESCDREEDEETMMQDFMAELDGQSSQTDLVPQKNAYAKPYSFNTCVANPSEQAVSRSQNYLEELKLAYAFAQARLQYRINQGAVIIEKEEVSLKLEQGENGIEVRMFQVPQNQQAQLIVSELMILANASLADFAKAQQIPLIYRSQDIAIPKEYTGIWTKPYEISKVVRLLSAAITDVDPRPHTGLGLKAYSPVTSPLRRYTDLINEAQLLHFLFAQKPLWDREEMKQVIFNLHLNSEAPNLAQRMRPRYWRYVYIQQEAKKHGEKCGFHAVISDENDMYVTVTLSLEQITVRAKKSLFGEKALLGQEVYVRLGKINPLRGEVTILAVQEA